MINGRVVQGTSGDVDNVMGAPLEKADLGVAADGELGAGPPMDDFLMKEGKVNWACNSRAIGGRVTFS